MGLSVSLSGALFPKKIPCKVSHIPLAPSGDNHRGRTPEEVSQMPQKGLMLLIKVINSSLPPLSFRLPCRENRLVASAGNTSPNIRLEQLYFFSCLLLHGSSEDSCAHMAPFLCLVHLQLVNSLLVRKALIGFSTWPFIFIHC